MPDFEFTGNYIPWNVVSGGLPEVMLDAVQSTGTFAVDTGRLPHLIGFLLRMAQLQFFDDFFRGLPEFTLRPGELSVLELIDRNPGIRLGQVAEILMILQPHMTKLARRLKARGLIERRASKLDRRSVTLYLTASGKAELDMHWERLRAHEDRRTSRLVPDEADMLAALLRKLTGFDEVPEG